MVKIILIQLLIFVSQLTEGQSIEIKGKIVDKRSSIPLSGVSVSIGKFGTKSNNNGYFSFYLDKAFNNSEIITFSYIGYQSISIELQTANSYEIALEPSNNSMTEVVVSSGAVKIIKKAIERIPFNYPLNNFDLTGILRIYRTETDSPMCYRFFKSDAIVKLRYPSYADTERNVVVSLIQNRTLFLKPFQAPFDSSIWIGSYQVDDFVHKKADFINNEQVDNFHYTVLGKTVLQGTTVWIIGFDSKRNKRISGTVFIDTASYAFVAAKYSMFNIVKLRKRKIKESDYDVIFQKFHEKWYLYKKSIRTYYNFSKASLFASKDFLAIRIDDPTDSLSMHTRDIIIRPRDEDNKVLKLASDSEWVNYNKLFINAEREQAILTIPIPTQVNFKNSYTNTQGVDEIDDETPFYKRPSYLEKTIVRLFISIDNINIRSIGGAKGSLGLGFGAGVKILTNTYFQLNNSLNFGDQNNIITSKLSLSVFHSINFSKNKQPIYLTTLAGANLVQLTKKTEKFKKIWQLAGGIGVSYPIKSKIRPFLNLTVNKTIKESGVLQTYYNSPLSISLGSFFIF